MFAIGSPAPLYSSDFNAGELWLHLGNCKFCNNLIFDVFEAGLYYLKSYHSLQEHLILQDQERAKELPAIEQFCTEQFQSLSLAGFERNKKEAFNAYALSFSGPDLFTLPNSFTFGSNMVFTCDEFINAPHIDDDCTGLALGFFFMAHQETGHLYFPDSSESPVDIQGAFMAFPEYGKY